MRLFLLVSTVACLNLSLWSQQPSSTPKTPNADTIMARVAANQDSSESEREHYLYVQHARVSSRKGKAVQCEEITDARVTPTGSGSQQQIIKLDGKLLIKGKYVTYTLADVPKANAQHDSENLSISIGNDETDRGLVESMRRNLTNNRSKDGIGAGLFPLTSNNQAIYAFRLLGTERINNRDVFHITFQPKDKNDYGWKGDAYIDTTAYQPVVVRTIMARKIPFAVRTLLGTSLPGLGFTVTYAPQTGGLWFPTSFGTEFKLHILFFLHRQIVLSAENRDFEKTHVKTTILPTGDTPTPAAPPEPAASSRSTDPQPNR